jgi:hypothetical protein
MDTEKLNKSFTLIANLAVVAGIVFLAFELRHNNALLESEIRTIRHGVRAADYLLPLEHPQYANALIKKRHGEPLTEYETLILNRTMATTLYNYQYVFTEYSLGRITENFLPIDEWRAELDGEISSDGQYWPDLREYWEIRKKLDYDPTFVRWMDENIVEPQL